MNPVVNASTPINVVYTRASAPPPSYNYTTREWTVHPCVITDRVLSTQATLVSLKNPRTTPDYRNKLRRKEYIRPLAYYREESYLPTSYFKGTRWEYGSYSTGMSYLKNVSDVLVYDSGSWSYPALSSRSAGLERAHALAITKLRLKLKDQKANLVQTFAEAKQLQNLVGDVTIKLAQTFRYLRAGKLSLAAQYLGLRVGKREQARYARMYRQLKTNTDIDKMLSSGVLSIQYGIRPLIQDVIGAAELYAQKSCFEVINTCEGKGVFRVSGSKAMISDYTSNSTTTNVVDIDNCYTVKYGVTFTGGTEVPHTLVQLGFSNPLLLAWELLPWSFVIDWFMPFGNYLSSLDATLGLKFETGYVSIRIHEVTDRTTVWAPKADRPDKYAYHIGKTMQKSSVDSFERRLLTEFPSPVLPFFKNPLSWEHALNGIALLAQFKKTVYIRQKESS